MELRHLEGATMDDGAIDEVAGSRQPAGEVAAVWTVRAASAPARPADDAPMLLRRRTSTRCRHCTYCHPSGSVDAICACAHPDRADLVIGDQMACGSFSPVTVSLATP